MTLILDKNTTRWSLRRALLTILLSITISVWVCSGVIIYIESDQESQELFDQSLAETAHLLLTLADHEVEERMTLSANQLAESNVEEHNQYLLFQIWDQNKRLLYKNTGAPDLAITTSNLSGFGWTKLNGQLWRTYSVWNSSHHLQIQVGEPISHRKEISGRFAYKLLLFAVLVLPLMAGAIWWSINRLFRVLRQSADEVAKRTPNDLRKVDLAGAPTELHTLLNAINQLFERVSNAMEQEQRFTANASHELRTPLAAIKTNLQVIQRARHDEERQQMAY
ncbi:sensor histidine kinase N-terminal domain-containing protein [Undibacterium sp. Xuan67W]|uniref:sensor histidine kinase N-terminal domain-containing protein n=1 Tax=Undibacterium sp. Xuan67W TaxID=3413057 RepID=UPI003BF1C08F